MKKQNQVRFVNRDAAFREPSSNLSNFLLLWKEMPTLRFVNRQALFDGASSEAYLYISHVLYIFKSNKNKNSLRFEVDGKGETSANQRQRMERLMLMMNRHKPLDSKSISLYGQIFDIKRDIKFLKMVVSTFLTEKRR